MRQFLFSLLVLFACGSGTPAPAAPPAAADATAGPAGQAPPAGFNPLVSLAPLVESAQPAVVNVYVTEHRDVPRQYQYFYGLPPQREQKGQGSGFVVSPDGYILTNNHVAGGADEIRVKFATGEEFDAKLIGADRGSDVALLKIDAGRPLPFLAFGDSDGLRVGDWVIAMGNPLGLGQTVTAGIVSGKGREIPDLDTLEEFIQTDASINPGNSGGPLVALDGTVVGMNTAIVSGANSVGFAIPAAHLELVMQQLRETGQVARGWLGVGSAPLSAYGKRELELSNGVMVTEVASGSPAALAGLRPGDVILAVEERKMDDPRDLFRAVARHAPGDALPLRYLREGATQSITVSLGRRPQE